MDLKTSKTWENLKTAMYDEALAYCEYVFYSQQAKKDGYVQISNIFQETADNELHHCKLHYKKLHDGAVPDTMGCLKEASASEETEVGDYNSYAKTARDEGFDDLADYFEGLAAIENSHDERFQVLMQRINEGEVFKRKEIKVWVCTVCGHIHIGVEAPEKCPVCDHPQGHFELRADNY